MYGSALKMRTAPMRIDSKIIIVSTFVNGGFEYEALRRLWDGYLMNRN